MISTFMFSRLELKIWDYMMYGMLLLYMYYVIDIIREYIGPVPLYCPNDLAQWQWQYHEQGLIYSPWENNISQECPLYLSNAAWEYNIPGHLKHEIHGICFVTYIYYI